MSMLRTTLVILAFSFVLSCASRDVPTQILVEIEADDDVRAITASMRVRVEASVLDAPGTFRQVAASDNGDGFLGSIAGWPVRHVLSPKSSTDTRYRVTVTALESDLSIASEARVISGYVAGETRVLRIRLHGGACLNLPSCPPTTTCEDGLCVAAPDLPAAALPRPGDDAGAPDADLDGGMDGGDSGECSGEPICPAASEGECTRVVPRCVDGHWACETELLGEGVECRPVEVGNPCDVAETCTGEMAQCPADAFLQTGTSCGENRYCIEGTDEAGEVVTTCQPCTPGTACIADNPCMWGAIVCAEDGTPSCVESEKRDDGTVCEQAQGTCDAVETCRDGVCSTGTLQPVTEVCRSAEEGKVCDAAETCDGVSTECPPDQVQPDSFVCIPPAGDCDAAEFCNGVNKECPTDVLQRAGTICRAAVSDCDISEACDGSSSACPGNAYQLVGTMCGGRPDYACDGSGACQSAQIGTECFEGCLVGTYQLSADGVVFCKAADSDFAPSGHVCRLSAGECDPAEMCTGNSRDCPEDRFDVGRECRPGDLSNCRLASSCQDGNPTCPEPSPAPAGTVCRLAASERLCDAPEQCDGQSLSCPVDGYLPAGTTCRGVAAGLAGACDRPEVCTGTSPMCPGDSFAPQRTTQCAPNPETYCHTPTFCSGMAASCAAAPVLTLGASCQRRPSVPSSHAFGGRCLGSDSRAIRCIDIVVGAVRYSHALFESGRSLAIELYNRGPSLKGSETSQCRVSLGATRDAVDVELSGRPFASGGFHLLGFDGTIASSPTLDTAVSSRPDFLSNWNYDIVVSCFGQEVSRVHVERPMDSTCNAFERKAHAASTANSMGSADLNRGNGYTHGNTLTDDFVCRSGERQNSGSTPETTGAVP